MATALAAHTEAQSCLITAFAHSQISDKVRQQIEESTFTELAACAFFCGAEAQFRKLSKLNWRDSQASLIGVVMEICNISRSKTLALIDTIHRLAGKYYLMENIIEQGKTAADQWLGCPDEDTQVLQELVLKYQNLSMFDLGFEGVNEQYDEQQQALYASVNQSVGKLRLRTFFIILAIISLAASITLSLNYL